MGFEKLRAKLEGLSEVELKLILEVAWGELSVEKKELLVRLVEAMKKVNEMKKVNDG